MKTPIILALVLSTLGTATAADYATAQLRERLGQRYARSVASEWGMHLEGVVDQLPTSENVLALTFDGCGLGGDGYDQELIDFLTREKIPATIFLTARWINHHPRQARQLADNPLFEIENHGSRHKPLSISGQKAYGIEGTLTVDEAVGEVQDGATAVTELTGQAPRYFRSGTAHYDNIAIMIIQDLGYDPAGFSVNGDAGATFSKTQVVKALREAKAGDIVIMHMNRPKGFTYEGLKAVLPEWRAQGIRFVKLRNSF